jgi:NAD(P)H-dependent flavin oxidoreductase YrpB (nitropropane dioxygenase family)
LREDIRKARSITDKPFGVNLSIGLCPSLDEMREVAIGERVPVIFTAAYRAEEHGRRIKEAGLKWVHKVVTVKHAVAAERHGADAVVIVGLEGTAFKNISQLPTLTSVTTAARLMKVPIIAAGGIGDARGLLAMGAEGVYMGTRFLATKECPVSARYKQKLVDAQPWDAEFRERCLIPPKAEEYDKIMGEKGSISRDHWLQRLEQVALGQTPAGKEVDWETDVNIEMTLRIAGGSLSVGVIDRVMSVKELIDTIIHDAEQIMSKEGNLGRLLR